MADFQQLETWADGMLAKLSPAQTKRLTTGMAKLLRKRNTLRILGQKDPEGRAWPTRKRQRKAAPVRRYVYRKKNGQVRELEMSSYRREAGRIIGYDKEARGIRTMIGDRVIAKVKPKHGSAGEKARTRKANKMMLGLARARWINAKGTNNAAIVQFASRAERIAAVHHWGLKERVSAYGPEHQYAARELLGISVQDRELIRDAMLKHLHP